jgi:hypothetical protein
MYAMQNSSRRWVHTLATVGLVAAMATLVPACGGLLDVSNPTLIRDPDIANTSGANGRRLDVAGALNDFAPTMAMDVALITDEWVFDRPAGQFDFFDKRDSQGFVSAVGSRDTHLGDWDGIYYRSTIAITQVRASAADSVRGDYLAQLYAIRGYAVAQLAEDMCSGFPLNDVTADNQPIFSGPLTTDSALVLAGMQFDSALKYVHDSTRFATLARVGKGRVLLDEGQYAAAAAVVAAVGTDDVYQTDGTTNPLYSNMVRWSRGGSNRAVGDREGGNGQPFVSAHDPRVPTIFGGVSATNPAESLYFARKYTSASSPVVLASGIEARLIEAEAAVQSGDPSWLTILNDLRTNEVSPSLPALADPGSKSEQVDLVYSERAFWLYNTGRRLGDLRRLIRNYGRGPETVFPTGPYRGGGTYETGTSIPFILAIQQLSNPHITTGCTTL